MLLLDSDVIIEFLRGREPITTRIADAGEQGEAIATTTLNIGEVLRGERDGAARDAAAAFLASLVEIPIDAKTAHEFARLMREHDREGKRLPVVDGFIAAATIVNGAQLVTRNAKHFQRIKRLDIAPP